MSLPMQKVRIPKTNLDASIVVLGTDYFGSTVSRKESMELMDYYLEAGGNVLDTAESYACFVPGGDHQSETVIGEWLRDRRTRDRVIISTKGAHPRMATMHIPRMSKAEIQSDLDSSLQRLGIECVDIYWLHRDAPGYPVEEILQSLESFRQAGKIRYADFQIGHRLARKKHGKRHSALVSKDLSPAKTCGPWQNRTSRKRILRGPASMILTPSGM